MSERISPTLVSAASDAYANEAERIAAAQRGNATAFNQLVVDYQELAFNVALRIVGEPDSAADVAQDAFLSAFRHLDQFKGGSFRSWLIRIVTNGCYDLLRSRQRRKGQSLDQLIEASAFDVADPGELPESVTLRHDFLEKLELGLQTLPVDQRAVLVLYDLHRLSYEEISSALDINVGTVKSRLSRARARLRDYLMQHPELWRD